MKRVIFGTYDFLAPVLFWPIFLDLIDQKMTRSKKVVIIQNPFCHARHFLSRQSIVLSKNTIIFGFINHNLFKTYLYYLIFALKNKIENCSLHRVSVSGEGDLYGQSVPTYLR